MHEDRFAPGFYFLENADFAQLLQVDRGRLSLCYVRIDEIPDAAIRLLEKDLDEFPGIDLGNPVLHVFGRMFHEFANRLDLVRRPGAGLLDSVQDEEDPGCPVLFPRDFLQQPVVGRLVLNDIAAQVQNRRVEQALFDEKQNVENTPRPAVAVHEGVNRLELVVLDRHTHERVDVGGLLHEVGPVIQLPQ